MHSIRAAPHGCRDYQISAVISYCITIVLGNSETMAGRGRGATLPAWMTAAGSDGMNGNGNSYSQPAPAYEQPGQYEDYSQVSRHPPSYAPPMAPAPAPVQYHSAPPVEQYQRHSQPPAHSGYSGHGGPPDARDYRDRRPAETDNRERYAPFY